MRNRKIPTDKDFARASAAMRKRSRGLSQVRDRIKQRFHCCEEFYDFFIMDCSEHSFRAYIFYRWDRQISEADNSGLALKIITAVYDNLEDAGRGDRKAIEVEFEFDSHENVEQNYEKDYFLRLR